MLEVNERFMVDYSTYYELHPSSAYDDAIDYFERTNKRDQNEAPQNEVIYLFPSTVIAFNLRLKKWGMGHASQQQWERS
jgi:hypothetical protein